MSRIKASLMFDPDRRTEQVAYVRERVSEWREAGSQVWTSITEDQAAGSQQGIYLQLREGADQPSKVSPFTEYLKKRWLEGCYNARQLYREIKLLGYEGHLHVLQAYLEPWRKLLPEEIRRKQAIPAVSPPTPRAVVWWLLKDKEKLKEEQRRRFLIQFICASRGADLIQLPAVVFDPLEV